jgi:hypothetical protein
MDMDTTFNIFIVLQLRTDGNGRIWTAGEVIWRRDWDSKFNLNNLEKTGPLAGDAVCDLKAFPASLNPCKIFYGNYIYVVSVEQCWCRQLRISLRILIAVVQYPHALQDGAR